MSDQDPEIQQRAFRITGSIESVYAAAKAVSPMPCDRRTEDLLQVAREALVKAQRSAWDYALQLK